MVEAYAAHRHAMWARQYLDSMMLMHYFALNQSGGREQRPAMLYPEYLNL